MHRGSNGNPRTGEKIWNHLQMSIIGDGHFCDLNDKPLNTLDSKMPNKIGMGRLWDSYSVEWATLYSNGKDQCAPTQAFQTCWQKKAITGTQANWSPYTTLSSPQISIEERAVQGLSTPASSVEAQREMQGKWPVQRKLKIQSEKRGHHLAENHGLRFVREWLKRGKPMILGIKCC